MPESLPYLSLVVAARNDDHGGSLLSRMQAFVNAWIGQCKRHNLSSELIVVDWNPPHDRPPLIDALRWPSDTHPSNVRFIRVPSEIHQQYRHAAAMPLYQMIAKNAGIRRARGRFVLATNIDIIFSDELVNHLAQQHLQSNRMYRIDRHDVSNAIPVDGTVEEQLAYCKSHLIRINAREGTFSLTTDGTRALSDADIAPRDAGITFGHGWFAPEVEAPQRIFRWLENNAEVMIRPPDPAASSLIFDFAPGPSAGTSPLLVKAVDNGGRVLGEMEIKGETSFALKALSADDSGLSFRLQVFGGGLPVVHDPRILNLRAFRCAWSAPGERAASQPASATRLPLRRISAWMKLMLLITRLAQEDSPLSLTIPVSPQVQRLAAFYLEVGGLTGLLRGGVGRYRQSRRESPCALSPKEAMGSATQESSSNFVTPEFLHTNACGDFTLMSREHWMDLRGYPEFDMYSFNIDSVLCYAAHHAGVREEILKDPMRIYHIEHGTGSGWTPEGQARLFDRLRTKGISWIEYRDLVCWAEQMRRFNSPIIFNRENWGLGGLELEERWLGGQVNRSVTA